MYAEPLQRRLVLMVGLFILLLAGLVASGWRPPLGSSSTAEWPAPNTKEGSEVRALMGGAAFLPAGFIDSATGLIRTNVSAYCRSPGNSWDCKIVSPEGAVVWLHVDAAGTVGP